MGLQILEAGNKSLLRTYILLPSRLHERYSQYVPPFYRDEINFHDPGKNKNLGESKTIRFLAYNNGQPVGRVMGIIYYPWNEKMQIRQARFFQLDCINDPQVAHFLLKSVEQWAVKNGMNEIIGSFGFSDKDPQGIQVAGFEFPPVIASVSHQPYLAELVAKEGYLKFKDCVSYRMEIPDELPVSYQKIYNRILRNQKIKLLTFQNRKDLQPYFKPVMQLMNRAYRNIFGYVAMDEADINEMAKQYLSILDPELIKIVTDENSNPIAFVIAMANISKGIRKSHGRFFPFGFLYILNDMRKSKQLDLLLGAVAEEYRGRGLNVLLGISLIETARKKNMKVMDSHLILEENRLMRAELEKLGGILHKRYRIFSKKLV